MATDGRKGSAPTLAIFLMLVLVGTSLVFVHLHSVRKRKAQEIRNMTISDTIKATNHTIQGELNDVLYTSTTTAMHRAGGAGVSKENVESYVREYLNRRISSGWNYPYVETDIPKINENLLKFHWEPDGSLIVRGYLNSEIRHVRGPSSYGTYLYSYPVPRFRRIKHVAEKTLEKIRATPHSKLEDLKVELNENYRCEGLKISIEMQDGSLHISIKDEFGGKNAIVQ